MDTPTDTTRRVGAPPSPARREADFEGIARNLRRIVDFTADRLLEIMNDAPGGRDTAAGSAGLSRRQGEQLAAMLIMSGAAAGAEFARDEEGGR